MTRDQLEHAIRAACDASGHRIVGIWEQRTKSISNPISTRGNTGWCIEECKPEVCKPP